MLTVDVKALVRAVVDAVKADPELRRELAVALGIEERRAGHLTVQAYATRHSLGVSTVRRAIREERLDAVKIGRSVRIPTDATIAKSPRDAAIERAERKLGIAGGRR